jgi:hypothetical protein
MSVAVKSSRHVLHLKKILEGDSVSMMPESGGFCDCSATGDGVLLTAHKSRTIFLSEKNIYKILKHVLEGGEYTTLELDEFEVAEDPK